MKRINVRPEDCTFVVDEDKRTIVCYITNTRDMFRDFVSDFHWALYSYMLDYSEKKEPFTLMPNRFVGVATCSPDDTWNEEFGKRLAFDRMKEKLHRSFFKRANWFVNEVDFTLNSLVTELNNYGSTLSKVSDVRHKWIEEHTQK